MIKTLALSILMILQQETPPDDLASFMVDDLNDPAITEGINNHAECDRILPHKYRLNAPALLYGSVVCSRASRGVASVNLLHIAQVRARADIAHVADDRFALPEAAIALDTIVVHYMGGTASPALFANPAHREAILESLCDLTSATDWNYQPGWSTSLDFNTHEYTLLLRLFRDRRYAQIARAATLSSNTDYQALVAQMASLPTDETGQVEQTDETQARFDSLRRQMDEIYEATDVVEVDGACWGR